MIANGTGLAPFLGMIAQNSKKTALSLYVGFSNPTELIQQHQSFLEQHVTFQKLKHFQIAFSRAENHSYVMDLIKNDEISIAEHLAQDGVVMICGSLQMQLDVEETLHHICTSINGKNLVYYKERGQILTDCY